jgi:hypothetical protein
MTGLSGGRRPILAITGNERQLRSNRFPGMQVSSVPGISGDHYKIFIIGTICILLQYYIIDKGQ